MIELAILTASIGTPDRLPMLEEAAESVRRLAVPSGVRVHHHIGVDSDRQGAGHVLNGLLNLAGDVDLVMVLDDDDLLHPEHLTAVLTEDNLAVADVIYTLPKVEGGSFSQYHAPFDARRLAANHNCVSHTALMRAPWVRRVGGWNDVRHFDLDLFQRLEQAGAEFLQIRQTTWTYRLHGSNWSQGTLAEAAFQ